MSLKIYIKTRSVDLDREQNLSVFNIGIHELSGERIGQTKSMNDVNKEGDVGALGSHLISSLLRSLQDTLDTPHT